MIWMIIAHMMDDMYQADAFGNLLVRETDFRPRAIGPLIDRALDVMPVVVITGARQTGKSTLVRNLPALSGHTYISLDDLQALADAREEPHEFLRRYPRIILDEVQREPALLLAIKQLVDEEDHRSPGRFVLTGSANLLLMEQVSESLAGRAVYLDLHPLTRRERMGLGTVGTWGDLLERGPDRWVDDLAQRESEDDDWVEAASTGGFPVPSLLLRRGEDRRIWFQGYVQTYLERDLQQLSSVDRLIEFRDLMRAAAHRLGGVMNQTEIGRDLGLPRTTVHRYLSLLQTSCLIHRLPPYSRSRSKRLVKSPKLYWADTGLAVFLRGEAGQGQVLENLILNDLMTWRGTCLPTPELMFWRTSTGQEVDFVIESEDRLLAVEVKSSSRVGTEDVRHLRAFAEENADRFHGGLLLYDGDRVFRIAENVVAAPWWSVL